MNFFLIPGNPPAVHFYELWGKDIRDHHPGAEVFVSPYPLLPQGIPSSEAMDLITLSHLEQLKRFRETVSGPVIIVGHSVGGYFGLKLLEKDHAAADRLILLYPFLRQPDKTGQLILKAGGFAGGSERFRTLVIRAKKLIDRFTPALNIITEEELLVSAQLALHEGKTIGADFSACEIPEHLRAKTLVAHTKNDWWCGKRIVSQLGTSVTLIECDEPHSFVVNAGHRKSILKKIFR